MKVAVMQPYLFPYIGYFQLMQAVDCFVIYDDVNYIKGGWINRNFVLSQGHPQRITMALEEASPNRLINEILVGSDRKKVLDTLRHCYVKSPHFSVVYPMIEEILLQKEKNLARFLGFGLKRIGEYLGLPLQWHISSELKKDTALRGQDKVLAICGELGVHHYINLAGGKELYSLADFASKGIQLSFIQTRPVSYRQFGAQFVPNLSIIDIMMFNNPEQCGRLLQEYEFV